MKHWLGGSFAALPGFGMQEILESMGPTYKNRLQYVAIRCNTLQYVAIYINLR